MTVLVRLVRLAEASQLRLAVAVGCGIATVAFGAGLMGTAGQLISRAAEQPPILSLTMAIVLVRFFGISRPIARYLERLASHDLAFRILARLRVRTYAAIEPLAPADVESFRRGDLLSRMVGDVEALQDLYLRGLSPALVAVFSGAILAAVSAVFLPEAALIILAGLAVAGIGVPLLAGSIGRSAQRRTAEARAALTADLVDALVTAPDLVAYGRTEGAAERVRLAEGALARLARREALVGGLADGLQLLTVGLMLVALLAAAIAATAEGRVERTSVALLALLGMATFEAVAPLPLAAQRLAGVIAAGRRVFELVDRTPSVLDPAAPAPSPGPHPTLTLRGVHLSYGPGGREVLRGVDLVLPPGRRVALVGASGSGKSSLAELLVRFRDPSSGRILLDGCDLRDLRQEDVRRTIALAGQEAHLFSSTIRENVRLARPDATDDEILEALTRARLDGWIASLPEGLDTLVGEMGMALSGGQRRRLSLARVLLRGAPILVLDEPTAHLDPPTAAALIADALGETGGRTVLLITHRPEGLDLVDEVHELTDGRLHRVR